MTTQETQRPVLPPTGQPTGQSTVPEASAAPATGPDGYAERLRRYAAARLADVESSRAAYEAAAPWPHLVLDDIVDPQVAAVAYAQEAPRVPGLRVERNHRQAKAETSVGFGEAAQAILDFLESPEVIAFVEAVTGIPRLEPDPARAWAGLHVNPPGAYHALHVDFTRHPVDRRYHRINWLVYLNPEWPDEWSGRLELWARGGEQPGAVVRPVTPHVVLFAPSMETVHGLPDPVTCPDGTARLSLAVHYYTHEAPDWRSLEPLLHRPRRPGDPVATALASRWEIVNGLQQRTPARLRAARRAVLHRARRLLHR